MLSGKALMEIDCEKIEVRLKNKTIYWSDVTEITCGDLSFNAIIKLKNARKVKIFLNSVKGDDSLIYKTILSYYKQATDPVE
jgi:hypothetical protein